MNYKSVLMAATIAALASFATGCGNVCDDAGDICAEAASGESSSDSDAECSGNVEKLAQCIVDADKCDAETLTKCATGG